MGSGIVGLRYPVVPTSVSGGTTTINLLAYGYEIDVEVEPEDEILVELEETIIEVELEDG